MTFTSDRPTLRILGVRRECGFAADGGVHMYGTIGIFKVQPGSEDAAAAHFNNWWTERAPKVKGAISGSVHRNGGNPSEFILSVVFDSKESYDANAADPEQDKWYQSLRALLSADPRWMDGDVVANNHI